MAGPGDNTERGGIVSPGRRSPSIIRRRGSGNQGRGEGDLRAGAAVGGRLIVRVEGVGLAGVDDAVAILDAVEQAVAVAVRVEGVGLAGVDDAVAVGVLDAVEKLEIVRERCPSVSMVLLSASYDVKGITALREFSKGGHVGCAYLLKHTVDTVEQLVQVIQSVAEGRIIVDPAVMEGLIATSDAKASMLKDLSPRELEVLSWMAKGLRNNTIAKVLCLEPKTVERHINNIYSKLGDVPDSKHTRVHAVTMYMRATGQLPAEDFTEV